MKRYARRALLTSIVATVSLVAVNFSSSAASQSGSRQAGQKETAQEASSSQDTKRSPLGSKRTGKQKPPPDINADPDEANENDPDRPDFAKGIVNHAEYLRRRQEWVDLKLGIEPGKPYNPALRQQAVEQMKAQEFKLREDVRAGRISPRVLSSAWTNIGPFPLPNGQTNVFETPVSGRVPTIVVHPTNPDIVYVGAAQGGVYRSTNGGQTWTQLFNSADSQAIGALAISPSNPEIVYVGTGEAGQCGSGCYAGIGIYRIDNASTTADLTGPINPDFTFTSASSGNPVTTGTFTGRSISEIVVHPTDPATIFVATASAIVGNPNQSPGGGTIPPTGLRGVYRSTNATAAAGAVSFQKLTVAAINCFDSPCTGNFNVMDIALDPGNPNVMVAFQRGTTATDGGVYRSTNVLAATPTFTQTLQLSSAVSRGEFGVTRAGGTTTMYLADGETGVRSGCTSANQGAVRKSTDGGATWSDRLQGGSGFCGGQCFYDIAVDVSPTDANLVLLGGNVPGTCTRGNGRSTDGGATFAEASAGLHADSHAVAFAPSNPSVVYQGNDGGIFRSNDGGASWQSLNNRTFVATQFNSVANHPSERSFVLGGTQDNGTELLQPNRNAQLPFDGWKNADFGDGGYARIDQTAPDAQNVVMYHTYFNQTNAMGIARVTNTAQANKGQWDFFGCGFVAGTNGLDCVGTTAILFYAPFELGPAGATGATGQTVYFGADTLYRSINQAQNFAVASQKPIVSGVPISTIGIAPQNDNVRMVGLTNGNVFATSTGAATLTNVTPPGSPARAVGRVLIDPNNAATAYVAYGGQNIGSASHIYKTTNLGDTGTTWTAAGSGIPDVPVSAMAIDPGNSNTLFAGTDIGVYRSTDGGANWSPFTNGMPKIAIFDLALQNANRLLRAATHGRGIYEIALDPAVTISGQITGANNSGVTVRLTGAGFATTTTDSNGNFQFAGLAVGSNYTVTPVANGTRAFTPASRSFTDVASSRNDANFATTPAPTVIDQAVVASPGQVIISEFRLRGANGAADEFVELYNNTDSAITVATSDGSEGWALDAANADGTRLTAGIIPVNTTIPARGHYLLAAQNYSLAPRATADFYYAPSAAQTDVADNTGLALYSTATRASFAAGNRLDAVGFTTVPMQDREGLGLAAISPTDVDYSYVRFLGTGLPQDTNNNAGDFTLVSPTGTVGAANVMLGSPGPENAASPIQRNGTVRASPVDMSVTSSDSPNYVRNPQETGANKQFGTLILRRRFTNNTGQTLTRLRVRIVDITTLNTAGQPAGTSDIRLLDSTDQQVTTSAGTVSVKGTIFDQPPALTIGGGYNASANVVLPDAGLASGSSINVQFKLGVVRNGNFRFFVNVEALP